MGLVLRKRRRGGGRGAVQRGADLDDGAAERGRGLRAGGFEFALAGARLVELGGELGAVLVEEAARFGSRRLDALGQPLLQQMHRPLQPLGREVQGAFVAAHGRIPKKCCMTFYDLRRGGSEA